MTALSRSDLAALAAARKPGHTLPGPFYTSREAFDLDIELIFARHWIFVTVEPDVPEPGDYVTVKLGPYSVIIIRDDDMRVRAFHNVCRHRGSRILLDEQGFTGNLVCPYHQWTYDLTGKLIHADSLSPCMDTSKIALKPVHLRSVAGLIYICLADDPPADFDEVAARIEPYLAPHDIASCKVAKRIDLIEEGNWKLTIENNRECYHCGGHPELLCSLFAFFGYGAHDVTESQREYYERYERVKAEFVEIWERERLPWQPIELLDGRPTGFRLERLALDGPGESYTLDARVACKKLVNGFKNPRLGTLHLHTQPNAWFHLLSDQATTFSTIPLGPDRTLVRTTWLVHKDAVEGVDYDVDRLTEVWRATNKQDGTFVGYAQSGATSPAYEPGPYTPNEYMVNLFSNWYIERLKANLDYPLAVSQV